MHIAFFGSSLVSAYWNGAATYYRGLLRALAERGHTITFYEPDAYERQKHRDIEDPSWASVSVYPATIDSAQRALDHASNADLIVKASGVGIFDEMLELGRARLKSPDNIVVFWDVDAPATLERIQSNPDDAFTRVLPDYDAVFTYGGGHPVVSKYRDAGARECVPIYNALDPETHYPVSPQEPFAADLSFLGNRLPDRERRVEEFFLRPAEALPQRQFLLGGSGWSDKPKSSNVRYLDHVYTADHNAFNASALAVLNISRDSMARYGYSPATRVFEAAGAGACVITDYWAGIEQFFAPEREILVAADGDQVRSQLMSLTPERARSIGEAALRRVLADHTYSRRAAQVEYALYGLRELKGQLVR